MQAAYINRTTTLSALSCTSNSSADQRPKPSKKKNMFQPTNTPVIRATRLSALITLLLLLTYSSAAASPSNCRSPEELVRSSCVHAQYPQLCLRTLSGPNNPRSIAQAAVRASLSRAGTVSGFLRNRAPGLAHLSKRERAALKDCVEQVSTWRRWIFHQSLYVPGILGYIPLELGLVVMGPKITATGLWVWSGTVVRPGLDW